MIPTDNNETKFKLVFPHIVSTDDLLEKKSESLTEKFKMAIMSENTTSTENGINIFSSVSECSTAKNTCENITAESQPGLQTIEERKSKFKGKKIFRIKKYVKYNKFLNEICSDEEVSECEKIVFTQPQSKKISPFSKVNFSKLNPEEKDDRLKNLAKLVKRLRRKVRNLENTVRFNASKLLNKHLCNKLGLSSKSKNSKQEYQLDFEKLIKVLKKLRNSEEFEYEDQRKVMENMINLIAEDKLKFSSLQYKKICSILRTLLPKERVKFISKNESKITVTFPEREVSISNKEYNKIAKFRDNEEIMRAALCVYEDTDEKVITVKTEKPTIGEEKAETPLIIYYQDMNQNNFNNSFNNSLINNILLQNMQQNPYNQLMMNAYAMNYGNLTKINNNVNQANPFFSAMMNNGYSNNDQNNQLNLSNSTTSKSNSGDKNFLLK